MRRGSFQFGGGKKGFRERACEIRPQGIVRGQRRDLKWQEYDNDLGFREGAGMLGREGCGDRAERQTYG